MSGNLKRGRGRHRVPTIVEGKEGFVRDLIDENPATVSISPLSESQLARSRLRERWELASVLNFLHVFQPVIRSGFEISAEEIEMSLITPNSALAQLHIALLKGIPPVSKNLSDSDAWVTVLCKKLAMWWRWVAEGEIPLIADHGAEILRYRELNPTIRLLILKALCEIRAYQDDTLSYIDETLKHGAELSTFRKERIGRHENGTSYWYDGDSVIGHRLYREINKVEFKQRLKCNGRLAQPTVNLQWETLATNLEEFWEISDKLSCSEIVVESAVGEIIKNDIIPVVEKLQKKKERALKRQQRQAILLESCHNVLQTEKGRSRRDRKPVSYTFDEYDRFIDEAIQTVKEGNTTDEQNDEGRHSERVTGGEDIASNGSLPKVDIHSQYKGGGGDDDDADADYVDKNDVDDEHDDEGSSSGNSDEENNKHGDWMHAKHIQKQKDCRPIEVLGLRRSRRTATSNGHQKHDVINVETKTHDDTKKRLRERPSQNTSYNLLIVSDSEDSNMSENMDVDSFNDLNGKILGTEKKSTAVAIGLQIDADE